jgi:acyl carrier protein
LIQNREKTGTRIQEWITEHFPLAKERNVGMADSLLDSGIVDSLGTLDIILFLEEEFGVAVDEDEMVADHFETVESITQLVVSKLVVSKVDP